MDTQKAVMLQVTNGKKVLHLAKVAPPVRIHMNAGRISSKSQKVKKKIQVLSHRFLRDFSRHLSRFSLFFSQVNWHQLYYSSFTSHFSTLDIH